MRSVAMIADTGLACWLDHAKTRMPGGGSGAPAFRPCGWRVLSAPRQRHGRFRE
jgi:hypothetical protein